MRNDYIKNKIELAYLHGENNNEKEVKKVNNEIREILESSELLTVTEEKKLIKIPYGNDGDFVIPVFSDEKELEKGLEYFRLNEMIENKTAKTVKLEYFKKIKENPNFLGLLINIATVSYIINLD
ncbi:hypothetical protein [uncultured Methanobrevibacter sp.]|uniref:hypothetical protein n=1 Tax=uncultured Methanobrevibacter sp. TaxID=253161 RepID=UPI0026E04051|nr:hypothetical protein [uncultured Methanobrevibacter sp.]